MLDYNRLPIEVMVGKKNLEVRPLAVNKGEIVKRILAAHPSAEFVFCAGDDKTDEDMFRALTAVNRAGETSLALLDSHGSPSPDKHSRPTEELAAAMGAELGAHPDQTVSRLASHVNDDEALESIIQDGAEDYHDSDDELAPHPWEAAMAIGATARAPASHHGTGSPMLLAEGSHPFSLYTVTVGPATKKTIAHWHVDQPANVIDVLAEFVSVD